MRFASLTRDDLSEVISIENECFSDPWPAVAFENELNNDVSEYYVLKEDDKVIGYAGMWNMFDNCDLVNIAIRKDYQGKGYGEKLLRYMIKRALQQGVEFMHLEVRVSNLKAYKLYRKYGFEEVRIRRGYYSDGEDCKDMVKGLLGLSEEDFSD